MSATTSYDRFLPISEKMAVFIGGNYIMGVGFGHGAQWLGPKANLLFFDPRHFLETGVQCAFDLDEDNEDDEYKESSIGIRVACRLQGKKGFTPHCSSGLVTF